MLLPMPCAKLFIILSMFIPFYRINRFSFYTRFSSETCKMSLFTRVTAWHGNLQICLQEKFIECQWPVMIQWGQTK